MVRPILLALHISGVLIGFGPAFASALAGPMIASGEDKARVLVELNARITKILVVPMTTIVVPGAALGLILTQHWRPFGGHRWLLTAIILYAIAYAIGVGVHGRDLGTMQQLLSGGKYRSQEWTAIGRRQRVAGIVETVLLFAILTLMVWKPDI